MVHLTNYSVQKYSKNFSQYEYGNEVSFAEFQAFLNIEYGYKKKLVKNDLWDKFIELIKLSCNSVKNKINLNDRKHCFEIFGYDFIMDALFNVFLLEVNTNPGLEISSPIISKLVPRMIDDSLRLTIDKIFETRYSFDPNKENLSYQSPYPVDGYTNSENLWYNII